MPGSVTASLASNSRAFMMMKQTFSGEIARSASGSDERLFELDVSAMGSPPWYGVE